MQAKQQIQNNTSKPNITPMMQQFLDIKEQHQDSLLFYRMGDFYELFFDDAIIAAKVLDIALTKRGKHDENDIPMCGVPHHSHEPYLQKLIESGYKVAICEQMESPEEAKKRGYKAVVKREVVRIVTPGTLVEDALLNAKESNYLASIAKVSNDMAIAWIDISTGEFRTCPTSLDSLSSSISRLNIKELLISDKFLDDEQFQELLKDHKGTLTTRSNNLFDYTRCERKLKEFYNTQTIDSFGRFSRSETAACGALIEYISLTQKGNLPRLNTPSQFSDKNFMVIDGATRRNLEISSTLAGEKKGSLLSVIDLTVTAGGGRLLNTYLALPLLNPEAINKRLDMVQFFIENERQRCDIREIFKRMPDIERALSRICIGKGGPKDLAAIRDGLSETLIIAELIEFSGADHIPDGIRKNLKHLGLHTQLTNKFHDALKDEVGVLARDGNFVKSGYNAKLDELRELRDNSKNKIAELREKYRQETGANNLKISHNNVLGYFVEVTPQHANKITDDKFIHRQTLASSVRYTTEELRQLESDIISAADQSVKLELNIFEELVSDIMNNQTNIALTAQSLNTYDVVSSLAELAIQRNYARPTIDSSNSFDIKGGRHPVVEANLNGELDGDFITNSCDLSQAQKLWLLTGPNMAGKSTFLRQNAIIAILAQIGSYIPADSAHIGTIDKVFSRVGASDDLARGRSTFMVEMVETATIINQATDKSLVILDEIGRGTATYDGLSIAWSVVEHLHNVNKCRGLFATHYHELTSLTSNLPSLACFTVKAKEWEGEVIFLHEVVKGAADRSYGIHVARLAGLPKAVTTRAEQVLRILEESEGNSATSKLTNDLPLFANNNSTHTNEEENEVINKLKAINLDEFSAKDALDMLYELKKDI